MTTGWYDSREWSGVGRLVRSTGGEWMVRPPQRCGNGHLITPGHVLDSSTESSHSVVRRSAFGVPRTCSVGSSRQGCSVRGGGRERQRTGAATVWCFVTTRSIDWRCGRHWLVRLRGRVHWGCRALVDDAVAV
jgi:hypothetical protein